MKSSWIVLFIAALAVGVTVVSSLSPSARNWGAHHYGFLTAGWWIAGVLAGLAAVVVSARKTTPVITLLLTAAGAVVFWITRPSIFLLGNGAEWQRVLDQGEPFPRAWYGTGWLLENLNGAIHHPAQTFAVVSVVAGVLFLGLAAWLVHRLESPYKGALWLLLAAAGLSRIFAGHIDPQGLFSAVVFGYLVLACLALLRGSSVIPAAVCWVVAVFLSSHGLLLFPSLLLLVMGAKPKEKLASLLIAAVGIALIGVAAPGGAGRWLSDTAGEWAPNFGSLAANHVPYGMFSPSHLNDLFQEQMLLGPAAVISALLLMGVLGLRHRSELFLVAAGLPWLCVSIWRVRDLGAARDWSLFAYAAIPWVLLTVILLARRMQTLKGTPWAASLLAAAVVFHFVGWTGAAQDEAAVAHMEAVFADNAAVSGYAAGSGLKSLSDYYARAGDTDRAVDYLARTIEADPDNEELITDLGNLLYRRGRADEAVSVLLSVTATSPNNADAWFQLGLSQREIGDLVHADSSFRRTLEIEPDHLEAIVNLHRTLRDLGNIPGADSVLTYGEGLYPDEYLIHMGRGVMEELQGRLELAAVAFESALRTNPGDKVVLFNLGRIYLNLARFEEAEDALEQLLAASELDAEAWINLGVARENLGKGTEAMKAHRRALEINPQRPEPYFHLSRMLLAGGNQGEALALMQAYVMQDSTSQYGVMAKTVIRSLEAEMSQGTPQ